MACKPSQREPYGFIDAKYSRYRRTPLCLLSHKKRGESIKSGRRVKRRRNLITAVALTIVIVCVVVYAHFTPVSVSGSYENISLKEACDLIEFESPVLLDVRTPEEYMEGHISGALLFPIQELDNATINLPKDEEILVYCRSGYRSARASGVLVERGYEKVYNMEGGILAWCDAGFPLVEMWSEGIEELELGLEVGNLAPDFTVTGTDGNQFVLRGYSEDIVIVDLMTTWCGYCIEEIYVLKDIRASYPNVVIISIGLDANALRSAKEECDADWTFAASRRVHDEYQVEGTYPAVYVLGENNIVRYKHLGFASFEEISCGLEIV